MLIYTRIKSTIITILLISSSIFAQENPNILFIVGDDMGIDAIKGFDIGTDYPHTPNLDSLRNAGLTFTNTWASPVCSATRASLITGKYGINNGVNSVPGILSTEHQSIFTEIKEQSKEAYKTCLVGKWHLSKRNDINNPIKHGVDEFMGVIGPGVNDYYNWDKVEKGKQSKCSTYATQYFTDYAINWISNQETPWFMLLSHIAPHTPFHVPPSNMYSTNNTKDKRGKYKAMIESLDYEIGRLLNNIPEDVLKNTVVIFLGDNGTPGRLISGFPTQRGKQTIYQGGISVPLIMAGKGVSRFGEKEDALINCSDFYVTFSQIVNPDAFPTNTLNNGLSFKHLLSNTQGEERTYNYMAMGANRHINYSRFTVRNKQYKLMDMGDGTFELYDLIEDPTELNNLIGQQLTKSQAKAKQELLQLMAVIRSEEISEPKEQTSQKANHSYSYPIIHTGVSQFYNSSSKIKTPDISNALYWQDAGRVYNSPSYTNNNDGTITDNVTGLMWQQNMGDKMTYAEAEKKAKELTLAGYTDWRIPSIKELYSLIQFTGQVMGMTAKTSFIDTDYFDQPNGDTSKGERSIDAQTWSSTKYTGKTMHADKTIFGVNFIDGRIKGYPEFKRKTNSDNKMYFRLVRGNNDYGKNNFVENGDGTISDYATGLMWQKSDDGEARDWIESIEYCENLELAGYDDWHLPNIKELQSIVDYNRSPEKTNPAAIDPIFEISEINDPENSSNHYPFFWSTTSHLDGPRPYSNAANISFGKSLGKMRNQLLDVHGAGAQRSDPKTGSKSEYPKFRGPQGDLVNVYNHCRAVRRITNTASENK